MSGLNYGFGVGHFESDNMNLMNNLLEAATVYSICICRYIYTFSGKILPVSGAISFKHALSKYFHRMMFLCYMLFLLTLLKKLIGLEKVPKKEQEKSKSREFQSKICIQRANYRVTVGVMCTVKFL